VPFIHHFGILDELRDGFPVQKNVQIFEPSPPDLPGSLAGRNAGTIEYRRILTEDRLQVGSVFRPDLGEGVQNDIPCHGGVHAFDGPAEPDGRLERLDVLVGDAFPLHLANQRPFRGPFVKAADRGFQRRSHFPGSEDNLFDNRVVEEVPLQGGEIYDGLDPARGLRFQTELVDLNLLPGDRVAGPAGAPGQARTVVEPGAPVFDSVKLRSWFYHILCL